ncbi:MAG: T9SS type A sorting domain-containing protein [Flavobacteriales bacterium]|nr:T9SS type A sorting domain-containing protein [Flavobacteriales bacterium]
MKRNFTLLFLLSYFIAGAQIWEDQLLEKNPNATVFDKEIAFNKYKNEVKYTKGNGYKPYARNLDFILQRTSDGKGIPNGKLYTEWLKEKKKYEQYKSNSSSNWTELGPINTPIILSNGKKRGNGRINCIAFDPFDEDIIWIGSPGGGLWKSNDGGANWSTNTDNLPVIGVSYIAINPVNPQEMYITTGDAHASDTYSIGILKSIDGGINWDTTGMQWGITDNKMVNKVIINPNYTDSIFAVTDNNIMISPNGGQTWSKALDTNGIILIGRFRDIEFKPNNQNTIYSVKQTTGGSLVYRSTDRGQSWAKINNGIGPVNKNRPLLAVTPANPDVVYVLFCKNDYSFHGIYKSSDNGDSWVLQSDSPNILGRDTDGTSTGGQSWYDLSLGVSTEDENHLYVGGINLWESTDGGISWNISGSSGNGSNYSYMHVDQHALEFNPLNDIAYAGNDGGLYEYMDTLNSWIDISDGLAISQFYKLGLSNTINSRVVAGAQDNGTEMTTNGVWDAIRGSDGMECAIDKYDHEIIYSTSQYGGLRKSYNGGGNWDNIKPVGYSGAWVTPWKIHPINNNIIVAGYDEIYRSQIGGGQWDSISYNVSNGASVRVIALAASNEDYIYSASYNKIKRTKDAGGIWTDIKTGLPNFNFSDITVAADNEDHLFVTYSEYQANHKVYESFDGGDSWSNITGSNLPNLPVNCIVHQDLANGDLYIGMDVGIYHRDNTMSDWVPYMNGLPNVVIKELEINYNTQKIVAATFGRGIWESDLNTQSTNTLNNIEQDLIIYPNPANDYIEIHGVQDYESIITIYSVTGKKVLRSNYTQKIDTKDLTGGCYLVEVTSKNKKPIVKKLIIE